MEVIVLTDRAHLEPVIVVHGGAGNRDDEVPDMRAGCRRAVERARAVLLEGGAAVDAAEQAVRVLEDDPLFNAGTGGALTRTGTLELDASIMEGTALRAGAVSALPPFAHPVSIARAALEDGRHVLYTGEGARAFAVAHGFAPVASTVMTTSRARERLEEFLHRDLPTKDETIESLDTVGAVALDVHGRLAAATSTGGTVGQRPGRVGDTPIIGSGTYADDALGACSSTGIGEAIMRACLAFRAVTLLAVVPAEVAAQAATRTLQTRFAGEGGVIVLDNRGRVGISRTTNAMSHAVARGEGEVRSGS